MDSCVCCGKYAGEGRQVCIICERAAGRGERSKRVQELEKEVKHAEDDIAQLEAENEELRAALGYYANSAIYGPGYICADIEVAKQALEGSEE